MKHPPSKALGMEWRWPKRKAMFAVSSIVRWVGLPNPFELIRFHTYPRSHTWSFSLTLVRSFIAIPPSFYFGMGMFTLFSCILEICRLFFVYWFVCSNITGAHSWENSLSLKRDLDFFLIVETLKDYLDLLKMDEYILHNEIPMSLWIWGTECGGSDEQCAL